MKTIFGNKVFLVGSIALLVILIQVVSGGMGLDIASGEPPFRYYFPKTYIGLDIVPGNVEIEQGSTVDYNIMIYNYQSRHDYFVIMVIPESCEPDWFDLGQNEVYIPRYGEGGISLNVTPDEAGEFKFKVEVISGNGFNTYREVQITVKGPNQPPVEPCLSYPTPNGIPELATGTAIKLNGFAVDPDGDTLYYRYWLKGPSTRYTWEILRDWNIDNTWAWKTDTRDIGNNKISMWIRDTYHAPADSYDLEIVCDYRIIENRPPYDLTLSPDKPEPQVAGTAITWTASATDPDGDELYYRFWIKGPTTGFWEIKRDWGTDNTWTWNTSDADVGDTDISVWILDGHHATYDQYDAEKLYYNYTIKSVNKPPCYGILVPTREEPQNAGTSITWVAYAEDPEEDTRYYRFWTKGPATSNSWQIKQDWSTNNIWVWDTTASDIGNTDISVWIRDGHHAPTNKYDLEKKRNEYKIVG